MSVSVSASAAALSGIAALPHLGVIRAQGEQAADFLQGQLTQDVQAMPVGQARLAAYCNAKGRMLASFAVCRRAPDARSGLSAAATCWRRR
jgi:folate-binding Fe-S cluster repair protein YgfZ